MMNESAVESEEVERGNSSPSGSAQVEERTAGGIEARTETGITETGTESDSGRITRRLTLNDLKRRYGVQPLFSSVDSIGATGALPAADNRSSVTTRRTARQGNGASDNRDAGNARRDARHN